MPDRVSHVGDMTFLIGQSVFPAGRDSRFTPQISFLCQGKRVATDGTLMQVASLLWAFDIEPAEGAEELDPWAMVVVGFMTMPKEAKVRLRPRGEWVLDVIRREWEMADKDLTKVMGTSKDVEG